MKIILAVSGGVDSVVMLNSLVKKDGFAKLKYTNPDLLVAHLDHGIRKESSADERFVRELANLYGLDYESASVKLGLSASEQSARKARRGFLGEVMRHHKADKIATAHHKDDVFETVLINLIRGTGRRGVEVLKGTDELIRPLINRSKKEIYDYATLNKLEFIEDHSNHETKYLRNKLRLDVIPKIDENNKMKLKTLFKKIIELNKEIDKELIIFEQSIIYRTKAKITINRLELVNLPSNIQREMLRLCLESFRHDKQKITSTTIENLLKLANRKDSNKQLHVSGMLTAEITKTELVIKIDHKTLKN